MKTLNIINQVYLPVLNSMFLEADPETGKIQIAYDWEDGVRTPVSVKEKTLHLPIDAALKDHGSDVMFFHPLAENVARGDSAVFKTMKIYASVALTYSITNLAYGLMYLAMRKDLHEGLNANQTKILQILPEVDEKNLKALVKFSEAIDIMDDRLVSIYTKRAGVYKGETYNRVAYISFPMLCDLLERKLPPKVKFTRKSDFERLLAVFDYILPNFNVDSDKNEYSAKSSSMHAPNFQALVGSYVNVMSHVQKLLAIYKTAFRKVPELEFINHHIVDLKPLTELDDLDKYVNLIPVLEGNEGPPNVRESKINNGQVQRPKAVPPTSAMDKVKLDMNNQQFTQQQIGNSFDQNQQNAQQTQNQNQNNNTGFITPEQFNQNQQQQQMAQQNQNFNGGNGFGNNNGFNSQQQNQNFNGGNNGRQSAIGGPTQANVMGNWTHGQQNNGFGGGFNNNGFNNNGFNGGFNNNGFNNNGFGNGFNNNQQGFNTFGGNNNGFGNNNQGQGNPNDALSSWNNNVAQQQQQQQLIAQQAYQNQQQQMYNMMQQMAQQNQNFQNSQNFGNNNQGFNTFGGFGGGNAGGFVGGFNTK